MNTNTRRPSFEQQRAAPPAPVATSSTTRGFATPSPPVGSGGGGGGGGGYARADRPDRPFYFPNQHQRSQSSEVSNKRLPALPRDGYGYGYGYGPGNPPPRGRAASASAGISPQVGMGSNGSSPFIGGGGGRRTPLATPPAVHKKSNSSLSSAETQTGGDGMYGPLVPLVQPTPPQQQQPQLKPTPKPSPNPTFKSSPHLSGHARSGSQGQTRYMNMLLTLDKIPRIHNILAAGFTWMMLAGFVILPATFTSPSRVVSDPLWKGLLSVSAALAGLGILGMAWLGLFWRRNYIWLLNRLYMPGTLNGLAGAIASLTAVYAQHRGVWCRTSLVAVSAQAAVFVSCGVLFVLYNNLLLGKVKRQHQKERGGGDYSSLGGGPSSARKKSAMSTSGFSAVMSRISRTPPFAPGSVV